MQIRNPNIFTDRWSQQIDSTTACFLKTFGTLTADQLNWRPDVDSWSIAQNIDHLIVINNTYYPILDALRSGKYKLPLTARFGFMVDFFGGMILKSVSPDRKKKMKTFAIWQPAQSAIDKDVLKRFELDQEKLKKGIAESLDLVDRQAIISSPANRMIVYKLETAFDIIVTHERRHFEQAKEVLRLFRPE